MDASTPEQEDANPTLVLFGATGVTGKYVLRQALADGLSVRAAVRSPHKLPTDLADHERLEVVTVDVTDPDAIAKAIPGAAMVVAALGYKGTSGSPLLVPFVRQVVKSMRAHGVRRFVYQASALNPMPGHPNPAYVRLLRSVLEWVLGTRSIWSEHDAIIRLLIEEASDLDWTVTRPGSLSDGASKGPLRARESPGGGVIYRDLAAFTLNAARSDAHVRSCPYLGYA